MAASSSPPSPARSQADAPAAFGIALAGNPNSGKTSLFNLLTGLRRKVGNYPGVTVERVVGRVRLPDGRAAEVLDLPGTYSLFARSEDERVARDTLLGLAPGTSRPDVVVAVVDAASLERSLFFATQLLEMGLPLVVALTMTDIATRRGSPVDVAALEERLGVPVVAVHARSGAGLAELLRRLDDAVVRPRPFALPAPAQAAVDGIAAVLPGSATLVPAAAHAGEALRLLLHARDDDRFLAGAGPQVRERVAAGRAALAAAGLDREAVEAEARYAFAREVVAAARPVTAPGPHLSERMDRFLTHPVLGPLLFLLIMGTIFQALFTWSAPMMEAIEGATGWAQDLVLGALDEGMLRDLLVDGVLAGVGAVVIFLPQICLLFLFLTILEDVGYLARAAFLVDRVMRGVGLSGRSFVPLMSSFACAIPGIMAARTIESRRDRFVTILVAPFMSCSARLPVYALMIGAFIPAAYGGWALLGMYLLSVVAALLAAWALRKTLFAGEASTYVMELPAYRLPAPRQVLATVYSRGKIFVTQAGTIILAFSIVLWALAYFPRSDTIPAQAQARIEAGEDAELVGAWEASAQVEQSFMGRMGKAIEPTIEPLGFDWRVGVGLVASFAAREVLVSTLGIVYSVGEDADEESVPLRQRLQEARRPDGRPTFTWLTALSLMVFFVLACQCMSTLAVVKRETASWRWPIFMFVYMTIVAYVGSLIVYQGGLALGWGG